METMHEFFMGWSDDCTNFIFLGVNSLYVFNFPSIARFNVGTIVEVYIVIESPTLSKE